MSGHVKDEAQRLKDLLEAALAGQKAEFLKAVRAAELQNIVAALATRALASSGKDEIILKNLLESVLEQRPPVRGRLQKALREQKTGVPIEALTKLKSFVDELEPTRAGLKQTDKLVAGLITENCAKLGLSPLIRMDLLARDWDFDAIGVRLVDIPKLSSQDARAIAERLRGDAQESRRPQAERASLYLQAAKLLLTGDKVKEVASEITFCVGSYCGKTGALYGPRRYDTAQDYLLEAVLHQKHNDDFPAQTYFLTALKAYVEDTGATLSTRLLPVPELLKIRPNPHREKAIAHLGLALLRLAERSSGIAWRYASWDDPATFRAYREALIPLLPGTVPSADPRKTLESFTTIYVERMDRLRAALKAAESADEVETIASHLDPIEAACEDARRLLKAREAKALDAVVQAARRCRGSLGDDAGTQRGLLLQQAKDALEASKAHGEDLAFYSIHVLPLVSTWTPTIDAAIARAAEDVKPNLSVRLFKRTYRRIGGQAELQLEVMNEGRGTALGVQAKVTVKGGKPETGQLESATLASQQTSHLVVKTRAPDDGQELEIDVEVSCFDADRGRHATTVGLRVPGAPPGTDFEALRDQNPFNAGDTVTDERMFFGREKLLERLERAIRDAKNAGTLRLVFGQRRVGKSSLLHFLAKHMREQKPFLVSSLTWLLMAQHRPADVAFDIARDLVKDSARLGEKLPAPDKAAYDRAYSVEFTRLIQAAQEKFPGVIVAILIDEFDRAWQQFTTPDLGFGEPFYQYLRGISQMPGVALVLAGGEELPGFLKDLGPSFNNAKRERASYLRGGDPLARAQRAPGLARVLRRGGPEDLRRHAREPVLRAAPLQQDLRRRLRAALRPGLGPGRRRRAHEGPRNARDREREPPLHGQRQGQLGRARHAVLARRSRREARPRTAHACFAARADVREGRRGPRSAPEARRARGRDQVGRDGRLLRPDAPLRQVVPAPQSRRCRRLGVAPSGGGQGDVSTQADRPPLHVAGRPGVASLLRRYVKAATPRSFAVVGLPGFEAKELFESIVGPAVSSPPAGVTVERLRVERRRPEGAKGLVEDYTAILAKMLGRAASGPYLELEKEVAASGRKLVLVISELEWLRLTEGDKPADRTAVEGLLDSWQVACTEGAAWLSVWACSHLSPAAICEAVSWSPFHKVFGHRIEKVGGLDGDAAREWLQGELTHNAAPADVAAAIVNASGGVPEVCEALLARVEEHTRAEDIARLLASMSLEDTRARLDRWLSPEQRQLLSRLAKGATELSPEDRQAALSLCPLGAIREAAGRIHLSLPIGLVGATTAATASSDADPFVRGLHQFPDAERPLIAALCSGHHFVDLEVLQHREGEARVVLAHPESKNGEKHRPFIIKVHLKGQIKKEIDATEDASRMLGSACPRILGQEMERMLGAYSAEFMTADSRGYQVWTYQHLFRNRPTDAVEMVKRVLGNVLGALYRTPSIKPRSANRYYRIPKAEEYEALERRQQECIEAGLGRRDGDRLELLGVAVRPCDDLFKEHRAALFET
ncbi:MAG TPA: hypothetical protein VFF73_22930, partial [Planctomycetota bacterium]|nr:hypothetical protein [Planctomycetota bacterium]